MRKLVVSLASLSSLALLAACNPPSLDGQCDRYGNWVSPRNPTTESQRVKPPLPGHTYDKRHHNRCSGEIRNVRYDRPGYYDENGYYIPAANAPAIPSHMVPPRGMCRVWVPGVANSRQSPVEVCDGISSRVPAGAYVLFGG